MVAIVLTAAVNAGRLLYLKDGPGKNRIVKALVHARKRKPHARHVILRFRFRVEPRLWLILFPALCQWARPFPGEAAAATVS